MDIVGIVCALPHEVPSLGSTAPREGSLVALADGSLVAVSGVGRAAAAAAARQLVISGATALASWGVAGGLDPKLVPGTVILPEEVISPEGVKLPTSPYWRERLMSGIKSPGAIGLGALLTSSQMLHSIADKAQAFRRTGAIAVDMESSAVAEVALTAAIPFLAVRVILDGAQDVLPPPVLAAIGPRGEFHIARLIKSLVLAPQRLPSDVTALWKLAGRYRVADRALAEVTAAGPLTTYAFPVPPQPSGSLVRTTLAP